MKNGLLKNLYIFGRIQYDDKVIPGFYGLFFCFTALSTQASKYGFLPFQRYRLQHAFMGGII
jgi:hypothetical protein